MKLEVYPILLIIAIIIFYLTTKKKTPQTVTNVSTDPQEIKEAANIYADETEEQFISRCYSFIANMLELYKLTFHVSTDKRSFNLVFLDSDGFTINYYINTHFSTNKKIIAFNARISEIIPDNKLIEISEFINRLNERLLVGSLYLSYETRVIENRLTYYVGDTDLVKEKFDYYYGMFTGVDIRNSYLRIIEDNENPALVALDWYH